MYTFTGSRLALKVLASGGAHVSYDAVKNWSFNLYRTETQLPGVDIIDNQVLQRRWRVKLRNEVKCNVVTIVVLFKCRSVRAHPAWQNTDFCLHSAKM